MEPDFQSNETRKSIKVLKREEALERASGGVQNVMAG
jgi:hypothetical protein